MDNLEFEKQYKNWGLEAQRQYPNEAFVRFMAEHYFSLPLSKRKKTRILEIGCGSGANLWVISRERFDAYGVDIAPTSIGLCKKMLTTYGAKAQLSVGNMKMLTFRNNVFEAIVDVMTIEHTDLQGHRETFSEIFRCLKKGGRFFSWHLGSKSVSFTKGKGKRIDALTVDNIPNTTVPYHSSGLTCFITPAVLQKLLRKAGFKDIKIERITRTYKNMKQEMEYFAIDARKP